MLEPLTIPGRADAISELMDYVAWVAAAAGLGERSTFRLILAVDEIATNIISYAYDAAGIRGELVVWAEATPDRLTVHLHDTGAPFDPRAAAAPTDLDRPPHEREVGGLGIYLALWGVDEFHYERHGDTNRSSFVIVRDRMTP